MQVCMHFHPCMFRRHCVCTKVRGWPSVYMTAFHLVWDGGQGVLRVSGDLPVSTFQLYSSNGTADTCYGVCLCVDSGAMNSGPHDCMANNLTHWAKFLVCPLLKSFLAQSLPLFGFMCQTFIWKCVCFTFTPTKSSLKCSFKSPCWNRLIFTPSCLFCGNVSYNVTATLFPHTLLRVGYKLLACWQLDQWPAHSHGQ